MYMVSNFKRCVLVIDSKGNKLFTDGIISAVNSVMKFVMFAVDILTEARSRSNVKWDLRKVTYYIMSRSN
jgi:hypothetical protein